MGEFWAELTQGSLWGKYSEYNPAEAAALAEHAQKKIAEKADFIPINITNTHTGNAILMVILTLSAR